MRGVICEVLSPRVFSLNRMRGAAYRKKGATQIAAARKAVAAIARGIGPKSTRNMTTSIERGRLKRNARQFEELAELNVRVNAPP